MATKIQWTQETWNVVTGCTRVSPGCEHCYIERTPPFRMEGRRFSGPEIGATTGVRLHADRLEMPLRWRKPRRVFVCSLADLFHQDVPDEFIARVFAVMALAPQHTFQVLTKRPARMKALLNSQPWWRETFAAACAALDQQDTLTSWVVPTSVNGPFMLRNVWLGVSVENQRYADERIPLLLDTPAAVRFISAEPLLGPVDLIRVRPTRVGGSLNRDALRSIVDRQSEATLEPGLDWVIVGGESGPGARPMHPQWARDLRDQCRTTGVAFFLKQMGAWRPAGPGEATHLVHEGGPARSAAYIVERDKATTARRSGHLGQFERHEDLVDRGHPGWVRMRRFGGHGGREHEIPEDLRVREYPEVTS
jgi:protein gp37